MSIPESFIEDLRSRVDIGQFIESTGVKLKKAGKSSKALCPLPNHDEKTPSFNVIHDKNFCYCHGCGGGGNVFDYVMQTQGLSFPEAVEQVATYAGMELPNTQSPANQDWSKALQGMLVKAHSIYQSNLAQQANPAINQLIKSRGINSDSIKKFGIGVAKDDWNQIKNFLGGEERRNLLDRSGLCIYQEATTSERQKFYDRFRNGIIFPVRDTSGHIATFAIRHPDGHSPKYINGPETTLFKKSHTLYGLYEALQHQRRPDSISVVEGYLDVIKMSQHGFENAVAPMGTAITDSQIQKLIRSTNQITFCFDGDKAGKAAAKKALLTVLSYIDDNHTFKFCILPEGEDPDSLIQTKGAQALEGYLERAEPFSSFVFRTLFEGKDVKIREDLANLANEFAGLLNQMPESHLKADLAKRFENQTGVPLKQSLNIKISTKDMSPSQIMGLNNEVRNLVAKQGGINPESVQVHISADHYQPESNLNRFINQQSIISQSLPVSATLQDKINLLNQAMEQVVINSNLSIKDESGIPVVQILTDAFKNTESASDSEKRLKMICIGQLKQILKNNDMSNLVRIISTEISRINKLGSHICHKHPEKKESILSSLHQFTSCVSENARYLDALGRFSPSEAYGDAYFKAVTDMKNEIQRLEGTLPITSKTAVTSQPSI